MGHCPRGGTGIAVCPSFRTVSLAARIRLGALWPLRGIRMASDLLFPTPQGRSQGKKLHAHHSPCHTRTVRNHPSPTVFRGRSFGPRGHLHHTTLVGHRCRCGWNHSQSAHDHEGRSRSDRQIRRCLPGVHATRPWNGPHFWRVAMDSRGSFGKTRLTF